MKNHVFGSDFIHNVNTLSKEFKLLRELLYATSIAKDIDLDKINFNSLKSIAEDLDKELSEEGMRKIDIPYKDIQKGLKSLTVTNLVGSISFTRHLSPKEASIINLTSIIEDTINEKFRGEVVVYIAPSCVEPIIRIVDLEFNNPSEVYRVEFNSSPVKYDWIISTSSLQFLSQNFNMIKEVLDGISKVVGNIEDIHNLSELLDMMDKQITEITDQRIEKLINGRLEPKRDITNNVFDVSVEIKNTENNKVELKATDTGLVIEQKQRDGSTQTLTFPSEGDGGEIALTSYVDDKIGDIDTSNLVTKDDITSELGDSTVLVATQKLVNEVKLGIKNDLTEYRKKDDLIFSAIAIQDTDGNMMGAIQPNIDGGLILGQTKNGEIQKFTLPNSSGEIATKEYVGIEVGKKITGGSVVQVTGTSIVDVMSQKAVTDLNTSTKSRADEAYNLANSKWSPQVTSGTGNIIRQSELVTQVESSASEVKAYVDDEIATIPKPDMSEYVLGTKHATDIASINKTLGTKQDSLTFTGTGNVIRKSVTDDLSSKVTTAQNRADSAYTLADGKWSPQATAGTGDIVRTSVTDALSTSVATAQDKANSAWTLGNNALAKSQNLKDLANIATARTNLGLGDSATRNMTSSLGTSTTLVASQKLVNDANAKAVNAQTKADQAHTLATTANNTANSAQSAANTADGKAVAAMNEANKKVIPANVKSESLKNGGVYYIPSNTVPKLKAGDHGLAQSMSFLENNEGLDFSGLTSTWVHFYVQANYRNSEVRLVAFFNGYGNGDWFISSTDSQGIWSKPARFYSTENTYNIKGFLRASGKLIPLTEDQITSALSDSKINPASIFIVNEVNRAAVIAQQSANNANEKANKAQQDATKGINDAAAADEKAVNAQTTANTGVANAETAQARADEAFSKVKPISEGGTGATTAEGARENLGIGNIPKTEIINDWDQASDGNTFSAGFVKGRVLNEWGDSTDKILSQGFLYSEFNKLDSGKFDKADITDVLTSGRNTVPSNSAIYSLIQDGIVITPKALPVDLTSSVYNSIDFYAGVSPETDSLNRAITYKGNKDLDQVNLGYGLMAEGSNFTLGYPLLDSAKPSQIVSISFYVSETQDVKQAVILQQLGTGRMDITLEGYALENKGGVGGVFVNNTWNLFKYDYNVSNNLTLYTDESGDLEAYLNGVLSFRVSKAIKPSSTSTNLLIQSRTNSYTYLHEIREVSTRVSKSALYDLIGRVRLKLGIPYSSKMPISNSALLFTPSAMIVDSNGDVVYSLNSETVISPASLVKVLTCDIALNILDINEVLTVSSTDIRQDSLLAEGDSISTLDAVKAAMLLSSNTSATLLARSAGEKMGGGLNDFLQMMELTAKSYGMEHTNFVNANGIYNQNQMTTVKDMCILGLKSRRNLLLTTVMSTVEDIIYINGVSNPITSTVANIGVDGIVSGKTGTISSPSVGTFNILNYVSHGSKDYVICVLNATSAVSRFSTASLLSKSLRDTINNL